MNKFILTEDERNSISKLHKNFITEQAVQDTVIQPGIFNQKVLDLQNHLNTKFNAGLTPDGKLGPKTLAAAQKALQTKVSQPATTTPVAATQPATATPEVQTSTQQQFDKFGLNNPNNFNLNADEYTKNPYANPNSLENKLGLKP